MSQGRERIGTIVSDAILQGLGDPFGAPDWEYAGIDNGLGAKRGAKCLQILEQALVMYGEDMAIGEVARLDNLCRNIGQSAQNLPYPHGPLYVTALLEVVDLVALADHDVDRPDAPLTGCNCICSGVPAISRLPIGNNARSHSDWFVFERARDPLNKGITGIVPVLGDKYAARSSSGQWAPEPCRRSQRLEKKVCEK